MDSQRVHQWKADVSANRFRDVGQEIRDVLSESKDLHFMVRHWLQEASKALLQRRVDPNRVHTCLDETLYVLCPTLNWADSD